MIIEIEPERWNKIKNCIDILKKIDGYEKQTAEQCDKKLSKG